LAASFIATSLQQFQNFLVLIQHLLEAHEPVRINGRIVLQAMPLKQDAEIVLFLDP
jgi:hypothetical protein